MHQQFWNVTFNRMSLQLWYVILVSIVTWSGCQINHQSNSYLTWSHYNGDKTGSKYSALAQINRSNVGDLKVRWTFKTGDLPPSRSANMECNPMVLEGIAYVTSPTVAVIALDVKEGRELWRFDTHPGSKNRGTNRGLAHWSAHDTTRIFFGKGNYLYCLDARDGKLISTFGNGGKINLKDGLNRDADNRSKCTTPGVIFNDLYILGATVGEGPGPAAPGYIRAFDVRTGAIVWTFHTIPLPGEEGYETWPKDAWQESGGANAWGGITLDEERGAIYCGTGSAAYDHWGGDRIGANLYANCILALDAATGRKIWHFQAVHHDIWDYDLPCAPNLVQIKRDGRVVDAVAQPTKMGHLFILDRDTGEPLFPIEEVAVPTSEIPGEVSWPTQPLPPKSLRYARQGFDPDYITDLSPTATKFVQERVGHMEMGSIFRPPGQDSALIVPQFNGGTDWGGAAYDPSTRKLFVNASNEAEWISMFPAPKQEKISRFDLGKKIFQTQCTFCHGNSQPEVATYDLIGLKQITQQRTTLELEKTLENGKGNMPSFAWLTATEREALVAFLRDEGGEEMVDLGAISLNFASKIPWLSTGHHPIKDDRGFPINKRPWGTLSAIDLDQGIIEWQVPLGTYPELEAEGYEPTGTFNLGGPLVTAGGLVFIAATMDERIRAFDKNSGEMLWEFQLEAGGYATPATFELDGEQFLMIAAGGGGIPGTPPGDTYYCFSL